MNDATRLVLVRILTTEVGKKRWFGRTADRRSLPLVDDVQCWFFREFVKSADWMLKDFWPLVEESVDWRTVVYWMQNDILPAEVVSSFPALKPGETMNREQNPLIDRCVSIQA